MDKHTNSGERIRLIPLTNRAGAVVAHAMVSEADYERVTEAGGWCLQGKGYVWRNTCLLRPKHVYLHRFVMGCQPGDGVYVDHINRDRLDNRRSNLRIVTPAQSRQNTSPIGGTSIYRGVHWDARRQRWSASVQLNRKCHHLGRFATEEEANQAAIAFRLAHMPFTVEDSTATS